MQVAFFCCFKQGVAGMSRDLGRDVPDLEKRYAGKFWADFSFPAILCGCGGDFFCNCSWAQIRAIFKAIRCAISLRSKIAREWRLCLRLKRAKLIHIAIPESAASEW